MNKEKGDGIDVGRIENQVPDRASEGNSQIIVSEVSGKRMESQASGEEGGEVSRYRSHENLGYRDRFSAETES